LSIVKDAQARSTQSLNASKGSVQAAVDVLHTGTSWLPKSGLDMSCGPLQVIRLPRRLRLHCMNG
jgi:hypothetical protein